jgi:hypothetical protein
VRRIDVADSAVADRAGRPGLAGLVALTAFWLGVALLAGSATYASPGSGALAWVDAVAPPVAAALVWIPLTVAIARASGARPPVALEGRPRLVPRNALTHAAASASVTFVLNAGVLVLLEPGLLGAPARLASAVASVGVAYLPVNAGVYWVIALGAIAWPALHARGVAGHPAEPGAETLTVRSGNSSVRVRVSEIRWIEGAGDYVRLHLPDTEHLLSDRLKHLEQRLDPSRFVRVHRSAIVNVSAVRRLRHLGHGDYKASLDDGSTVRVARTRRARLAEALEAREVPEAGESGVGTHRGRA